MYYYILAYRSTWWIGHCIETILLGIRFSPTALATRLMSEELDVLSGPPQICRLLESCHFSSHSTKRGTNMPMFDLWCVLQRVSELFLFLFCPHVLIETNFLAKHLPYTCCKKSCNLRSGPISILRLHLWKSDLHCDESHICPITMEKADLAWIRWRKKTILESEMLCSWFSQTIKSKSE